MEEKLVSVIIPTYGRPARLERAINSVLKQNYKKIELIVVDDNNPNTDSRVSTEKLLKKYQKHDNIKYLKHSKNKNGSAARNTGFHHSNGDYIMFLDDDDEFLNNKVLKQVEKMNSLDINWGASYTSYIRKKGKKTIMYSAENREGNLLNEELGRNLFVHAGSNLMLRREVVEELNGFDENFTRNQDIEFLTRVLKKYKLAYVDELGLIIHQSKKKKVVNFEKITENYLNTFSKTINSLEENDKEKIYTLINLQVFRYYLRTKKYRKAIKYIKKNKINIVIVIRYLFHLLHRAVTKKAYGFTV